MAALNRLRDGLLLIVVACFVWAVPLSAQQPQRVRLIPRFTPGQVLTYKMEFRTTSEAHVSGAVENPQAPSLVETAVGAQVRLEVLDAAKTPACQGCVRIRVTYDQVVVTTKADVQTPELAENEKEMKSLEGRSFEFTMTADGKVGEVSGPGELAPSEKKTIEEWLVQLAGGSGVPAEGVVPGQKWTSQQPIVAPLRGVVWHSESTYLRDEPCRTAQAGEPAPSAEKCAAILSRFEISRADASGDPTPEEYRLRGMRTAGDYTGSGESLAYISLATGWVMSVTQQGSEQSDLTVTSVDDNTQVHYAGRVRRQSSMMLLPPAAPKP